MGVSMVGGAIYADHRLCLRSNLCCMMTLEAIKYDGGRLEILDQLLLPDKSLYERITSVEKAWEAIRTMKV